MASSSGAKYRQSTKSFPSRGYVSSPSAFASSSSTFSTRSSTFLSRSSSPKHAMVYGRSSSSSSSSSAAATSSVRFQIDRRSASPGRSISVKKKKKASCMCSPTTHPGSFRCSLHKNSGGQIQNGLSFRSSSSALNCRRSAMKNSLVRIGGVEGADLVKRALSALIRPSSNQQRRRSAFQPRPSRLGLDSVCWGRGHGFDPFSFNSTPKSQIP